MKVISVGEVLWDVFEDREFLGGASLNFSANAQRQTICITLGGEGCAVFIDGTLRAFSGYTVKVVDTVGAGYAFAVAFLHGLHLGWPVDRIAPFANALGALVASRAGATPA